MLKLLIKRLIVIGGLFIMVILFTTCNKNDITTQGPFSDGFYTYTYNHVISGYVYKNCSNSPAANYPLVLTSSSQNKTTYYTDNTGHFSVPYTYSTNEGNWNPTHFYWLILANDSVYIVLEYDTAQIHNSSRDTTINYNLNFILNDSARFKAIYNFSQSYTDEDTLYYQLKNSQYPSPKFMTGPFAKKVVINFNVPLKYLGLTQYGSTIQYEQGFGFQNFEANDWFNAQYFTYYPCSVADSIVVDY